MSIGLALRGVPSPTKKRQNPSTSNPPPCNVYGGGFPSLLVPSPTSSTNQGAAFSQGAYLSTSNFDDS